MKRLGKFKLGGMSLGIALAVAAFGTVPAVAGPFGSAAEIRDLSALPLVDVQVRRARPAGRPVGRPVSRKRGRNGAAVAGALIGAAIVGGAIIANSQPRRQRQYYVDDGYHDGAYYGGTSGYVVQQPQPYYGGGAYYQQPEPYYGSGYAVQPNYGNPLYVVQPSRRRTAPQTYYAPDSYPVAQPRGRYYGGGDVRSPQHPGHTSSQYYNPR